MGSPEDQFQYWLMDMDDAISRFFAMLPADVRGGLDFSPQSLDGLEAWLLHSYPAIADIRAADQSRALQGAACYVGELFRKHLGGKWMIDFSDPKNVFHGLPQLSGMAGQIAQCCPMTMVTASLDRRTGDFLSSVFGNMAKRAAAKR